MKKHFFILLFVFQSTFAQTVYLSDDFEDGDMIGWIESNPDNWIVTDSLPIMGNYSIINSLNDTTGDSYLVHDLSALDVTSGFTTWQMIIKNGDWEPSSTDKFWIYVFINDLTGDGYSVGVNKGSSSDTLRFVRVHDGAAAEILISSTFKWGINDTVGIKISRDRMGYWEMAIDTTGNLNNFIECGSVYDNSYIESNYFGLVFYFTPLSAGSLWFDDVLITQVSGVAVPLRAFLEGPFNTDSMNISLREGNYLPLSQPYSNLPWNYTGTEGVVSIPENVVDWLLVELRSGTSALTSIAKRVGFIMTDGSIVDTSGSQPLFFSTIDSSDYYIILYHRNHLSIMSAEPVRLTQATELYDFSTGLDKTYGANAQKLLTDGIYSMYAGDANANGQIQTDDKNNYWRLQIGNAGYWSADYNLNGQVQTNDKNSYWNVNIGLGSQVPQ